MTPQEPTPCSHDWEFIDDSFDHEFGIEIIRYEVCAKCGETRKPQPADYCPNDDAPHFNHH